MRVFITVILTEIKFRISEDKVFCKHYPKMKLSERKDLRMRSKKRWWIKRSKQMKIKTNTNRILVMAERNVISNLMYKHPRSFHCIKNEVFY